MWKEPKTNRTSPELFSCDDMNRICGNINYLMERIVSPEYKAISKDVYIESDIVTKTAWDEIIGYVNDFAELLSEDDVTDATTWQNMNAIEMILYKQFNANPMYPNIYLYPSNILYPH